MKDRQLEFWTTPPSVFLVATNESEQVIGCISYKQINLYTVEMHRLRAKVEFRHRKIGQKLVQALMDTAKENGYDMMYCETSNPQIGALKLYEKMNFRPLHDVPFPWPILDFLSGLKVKTFVREINAIPISNTNSLSNTLSNHVNPLAMSAATLRLKTDIEIQNQ